MPARVFTSDYVERCTLRDGTSCLLRLVTPEDMELLRHGFERWSAQSRYTRFLAPKQRLSDAELRYLCAVDQETHFALGAIRESAGEPRGLGIARFIELSDTEDKWGPTQFRTAEAAIAVADELQGQGLGRILFARLVAAAAERGIERFRCEVLAENDAMKTLIEKLAPVHQIERGAGIVTIDFALPSTSANVTEHQESPIYRFFRAAAENAIEWTEAVTRFWRR
jgi:ribosomal protein S18 acetylase RimI-like enzyme